MSFIVAITDYVFPSLEPEQAVLAPLGVEPVRNNAARRKKSSSWLRRQTRCSTATRR